MWEDNAMPEAYENTERKYNIFRTYELPLSKWKAQQSGLFTQARHSLNDMSQLKRQLARGTA